jgi:hypothetical protein
VHEVAEQLPEAVAILCHNQSLEAMDASQLKKSRRAVSYVPSLRDAPCALRWSDDISSKPREDVLAVGRFVR